MERTLLKPQLNLVTTPELFFRFPWVIPQIKIEWRIKIKALNILFCNFLWAPVQIHLIYRPEINKNVHQYA